MSGSVSNLLNPILTRSVNMPFLVPLIGGVVKTLCMSMLSEKLLTQVILVLLTRLCASTSNKIDDEFLILYKKSIEGK